jgi:hypothetical protein
MCDLWQGQKRGVIQNIYPGPTIHYPRGFCQGCATAKLKGTNGRKVAEWAYLVQLGLEVNLGAWDYRQDIS